MANTWNCHGSTVHAYDGSGNGSAGGLSAAIQGWEEDVFTPPINWENVAAKLDRGDIVAFYAGAQIQHSHTSLGGTTMYGANNEAVSGAETWKWAESTSQDYWNLQGVDNHPYPDCDKLIIYNRP